ncbi:Beta-glucuronidase 1 [Paraphaeosphaeria minitans]|uniref:Beta-glucuronidase 1 n=1 Tax=Paraphaeosphaeria minitans TaxID=565426 RepID=A0A9P6GPI2_9PLEO|nr:Beta-glucuronidase 1 [Paraphaeosphaeria minitans]
MADQQYPRPDWQRPSLSWQSLNGPWSFLFDDNDVGQAQGWQLSGLPSEVSVDPTLTNTASPSQDSEGITTKIIGDTQALIKGNVFKSDGATRHQKRDIQVPYVWQCPASGIEEKGVHEVFWYERNIRDLRTSEQKEKGDSVSLRFGAVDYEAKVWVDGSLVGGHRGGHVPFSIDVTDAFAKEVGGGGHRVTIRVYDSAYDLTQPRGKQYWGAQPESIFYTPSGGIWQSVWLEVVPKVRLGDSSNGTVLRSDDIEHGKLKANVRILDRPAGWKYAVGLEVKLGGVRVSSTEKVDLPRESDFVSLEADMRLIEDQASQLGQDILSTSPLNEGRAWLNNVALWSPEHPTLYTLTLSLYDPSGTKIDEAVTTTGMRKISWNDSAFRLNNRPYFQALFLDQGYWPRTFMTPPAADALKTDIQLAKNMGFNGCRKHQKVEDPLFHYWADRLGFLIWGEMANAYSFSSQYVDRFDQEWREAVLRDINHPSVVAWTPVNESWAYTDLAHSVEQRNHIRSLYYATKVLDPTRPVNDNCGWEHVKGDLTTFHDYSDGDKLTQTCKTLDGIIAPKADRPVFVAALPAQRDAGARHDPSAPIICTEFGGINIAHGEAGTGERDWGYTTASDAKDLLKRIETIMRGIVEGGHVCGFVYTQLTDIEQEVNGLYTLERKEKLDAAEMKKIVEAVVKHYDELQK